MESKLNKKEFVKSLNKVKVVLGNGFDLHCGLYTSYNHYYCYYYKKFLTLQKLYSEFEKIHKVNFDFGNKKVNVWDVFFALNSDRDPKECKKYWCDIEKLIVSSFLDRNQIDLNDPDKVNRVLVSKICWLEIENCITKHQLGRDDETRFMTAYFEHRMTQLNLYPDDFYKFLLNELKDFEKEFGSFIYSQLHDTYSESYFCGPVYYYNQVYIEKASDTLNELCSIDKLVSIDSFNYSYIYKSSLLPLQHNINGTLKSPIFGTDTIFEPKDPYFTFTKTSRRMDNDFFSNEHQSKNDFENLIVYGHSLNPADYGYFFPIFDNLHLTDSNATNVIVFAYSIFNKEVESKIKTELRESISNILYEYAKSKKLSDPKRFLDSLSVQNRIIIYEIPELNKTNYRKSCIDDKWEKIMKEIDSL